MEHWELTADFRVGCSSCSMTNSFVPNAELIETTAVSCCHLHQLLSQTTQYLDSWQSVLLQSELKMKLLEVEGGGARAPELATPLIVTQKLGFSEVSSVSAMHLQLGLQSFDVIIHSGRVSFRKSA